MLAKAGGLKLNFSLLYIRAATDHTERATTKDSTEYLFLLNFHSLEADGVQATSGAGGYLERVGVGGSRVGGGRRQLRLIVKQAQQVINVCLLQ